MSEGTNEAELSDGEYVDYKVANWANMVNCNSYDKGNIIKWLVGEVREMSKDIKELKNGGKTDE